MSLSLMALALVGAVFAEDTTPQLEAAVKPGKDGKLTLEVKGVVTDDGNWLGVSFYTPTYLDPIWDAEHSVTRMEKGPFSRSVAVPAGFAGGTFEVALWRDKVAQREVFRLDSIRGYGAGAVASGSYTPDSTWTLPLLKTDIETRGAKTVLVVSGLAPDKQNQLGVSFYRAGYADPVLDGDYAVYPVGQGSFTKRYNIPAGFETATYEVALWARLLNRKYIYKLEGIKAYTSGVTAQ